MPRIQQLAQGAHQLGDVVEVQTGGRLVQHEERATLGYRLAAGGAALGGFCQETGQLQTLRLATRQRGHGLAQLHILQAHINDGLQCADHVAIIRKQVCSFGHGQVQYIGHIDAPDTGGTFGAALDRHFQNLGTVTFSIAIRAAQIHVAQELHLDMLKTRTAAGGTAPVATIKAELAGGVAAFTRQISAGKQLADRVPRAHIAYRVGACGFANRRLVYKHHFAQLLGAQQARMGTRCFGCFAEVAQQGWRQHVLYQRGLTRATDPGHTHQVLQWNIHRDVLQVVLGHAFQNQARRVVRHDALKAHADLLAAAQISAG